MTPGLSDREINFIIGGPQSQPARGMPSSHHITLKCDCGWTCTADKQLAKELNKKHLKFERHQEYLKNLGKPKTETPEAKE